MPLVLLAPLSVVVIALASTAWLVRRLASSVRTLEREVTELAQLGAAREVLATDLERARAAFGPRAAPTSDVWPPGRAR